MNIITNFISVISQIINLPFKIIEEITFFPDFIKDALIDSIKLLPFLFIMFIIIEIIEQYFTKKKHLFVFFIKKIGPLFGSLFASIPQCGFSVIASTLYTKRILTRGTLISVYLATSDEAIPVLMAKPSMAIYVIPMIVIKVILAIIVGYIVDLLFNYDVKDVIVDEDDEQKIKRESLGCCHHHISLASKSKEIFLHPLKHTINIFLFILIVSIILGYILSIVGTEENMAKLCLINTPIQPILVSVIGLIPNCAISVMLTVLFIKHIISFGALLAGLSSAGGLGILVLLNRNKNAKDTTIILSILIVVSSVVGLIFQYNIFNINHLFKIFGINM